MFSAVSLLRRKLIDSLLFVLNSRCSTKNAVSFNSSFFRLHSPIKLQNRYNKNQFKPEQIFF